MKNIKFIASMIFWCIQLLLALGMIVVAVNDTMQYIETWNDVYYLPEDLDRSFLVFGFVLFFLSMTAPFLLIAIRKLSNNQVMNKLVACRRLSGWLKGLSAMWAVLSVFGLVLIILCFFINSLFQMDAGPSGLSWFLFIQGSALVVMGLFICPLLLYFYKQTTVVV